MDTTTETNDKTTFQIGDTFFERGKKHQEICTVEDIYTTRNHTGHIVKIEYRASHNFLGQKVYAMYSGTTIAIAKHFQKS